MKRTFLGRNGSLQGEVIYWDGTHSRAPVISVDNVRPFDAEIFPRVNDEQAIREFAERLYKNWGKFGPYGDVIQVTNFEFSSPSGDALVYCSLDFIGRLEYYKPSLAVDLLIFIKDLHNDIFFVSILRDKEPGLGLPAFIGGHRDIRGFDFETPAEALLHEASEEAAFYIKPLNSRDERWKQPYASQLEVQVKLGKMRISGVSLECLGTWATGVEEESQSTGRKRVDETTAYMLCLQKMPMKLDVETVAGWFKAGSDAKGMHVVKLKYGMPKFGLSHHNLIFAEAIKRLEISHYISASKSLEYRGIGDT